MLLRLPKETEVPEGTTVHKTGKMGVSELILLRGTDCARVSERIVSRGAELSISA